MSCQELVDRAIKPTWQNRSTQHSKIAISTAISKTIAKTKNRAQPKSLSPCVFTVFSSERPARL
jgi:hypothetical protein